MGDPRLGPHLLIGGSHDGEREEFDAFVTERVRKINVAASTKPADARYGKTIAQMAAVVVYEDYDRVVVRREPPIFIYAFGMSAADALTRLVAAYPTPADDDLIGAVNGAFDCVAITRCCSQEEVDQTEDERRRVISLLTRRED